MSSMKLYSHQSEAARVTSQGAIQSSQVAIQPLRVIELKNVSRFYQTGEHTVKAVDNISFSMEKGEFTVLAGPSGSGKTTVLNLIGGLDQASAGEIYVDHQACHGKSERELTALRRQKIGFVFQAYNLLPVLTVRENIQLMLQIKGIADSEHQGLIEPLLQELGLADYAHRFPRQLSGGQQQRVAVARAVVTAPAIVLADEPTANLDSEAAINLLELMQRLNKDKGISFLFSSHDNRVIERSRRVIHLRDGQIDTIDLGSQEFSS